MWRLSERIKRSLRREEGVSMVLVGVMLAVILGLAGMAVDLGVVYAERRELRTGADAAALAIAEDCGVGNRPCDDVTARATAEQYADANAWDDTSTVESVTLTITGATTGSVRVVTSAWDAAAGLSGVRVPLMSMLGVDRVDVGAAATAIFDHPSSLSRGLPMIIDTCEFDKAGGYGPAYLVTLYLLSPSSSDPPPEACPANPAHMDFPGGFGWLDPNVLDECAAALVAFDPDDPENPDAWAQGGTGTDIPAECADTSALRADLYDQEILLPMYLDINFAAKTYLVRGFSSFHVTDYKLTASSQYASSPTFRCPLSPAAVCLQGYFVDDVVVYDGDPGGDDFGVVLVKLVE
jgi:Flp pilus assembly protein TadG